MNNSYISPLSSRYGSDDMKYIWSEQNKVMIWRHLWCILAETQQELGVDFISDEQIKEMKDSVNKIDLSAIASYEEKTKHDVVANIHAFGAVAQSAQPIIHLGATSQFVVDNAESIMIRDSLVKIIIKTAQVIDRLSEFAEQYADLPTIGLTHLQPAQPTTVGKRTTMWIQDFVTSIEDLGFRLDKIKLRGAKGTTGTQASFLNLFNGDASKVKMLDEIIAEKLGFGSQNLTQVSGQTNPRINDALIVSSICLIASAASKFSNDIRLLSGRRELSEGFDHNNQVGSSAMAYKQNPITCEKITSLSRYLISLVQNPYQTAANQWMERSLDDSANKRLLLPEVFILVDEILDSTLKVANEMVVNTSIIEKSYKEELPFFITENVIIEAIKRNGVSRQDAHEEIRKLTIETKGRVTSGKSNNLVYRISRKKMFKDINVKEMLDLDYTGLAKEQTFDYISTVVSPIRQLYLGIDSQLPLE